MIHFGGLTFFELADDDVIYSNAHIAKVWTLEPTALADARQALVNIRAGKELKDEFEGKTAVDVEQEVLKLEEQFCAAAFEPAGEPEPEPETAIEAGGELAQLRAELARSKASEAESATTIADLRAQLAAARAGEAAEGVPPV